MSRACGLIDFGDWPSRKEWMTSSIVRTVPLLPLPLMQTRPFQIRNSVAAERRAVCGEVGALQRF